MGTGDNKAIFLHAMVAMAEIIDLCIRKGMTAMFLCESGKTSEAEMADARQDMENRIRDFHVEAASHVSHIAWQTAWKTYHRCTIWIRFGLICPQFLLRT